MASDALKIARLEASTQLTSQVLSLAADPLWSTIGGFVVVHELRKRDLIGPVADDILYAGIISVNAARQPALLDLAGKGLSAGAAAAGAVAGAAGAAAVGKAVSVVKGKRLLAEGSGELKFSKALKLASKGGQTLTVMPPGTMPSEVSAKGYAVAVREGKWWQIWRALS
jgi:hypothetical protein